eukprot:Tamp_16411.p1 GENE.Tamp_16411~~Tamp_16411.p1  ORF type:complete len:432 (-),score=68.71 Tamp_16411:171-1436(-)
MPLLQRAMRKGAPFAIDKVYPLDAVFSAPDEVSEETRSSKRYAAFTDYDIQSCAAAVARDYGRIDILVHSLANGPQVDKPLLETNRASYLAASSASAYSMVSMVQHFARYMPPGGSCVSLSFIAAERVIPGYGGGMSSAKAQLESDTKVLAWEAGRKYGIRVNAVSAGPLASRAASAIQRSESDDRFIDAYIRYCRANSPLARPLEADDVGRAVLALSSDLSAAITGTCLYVDNGMHAMGLAVDSKSLANYMGPAGKAPPVAKLEPANSARSAQKHAAAPSKGAGGSQLQAAPVKKAAGAQGSSAFKKLVLAAVVLVLVVLGAVLFASKAPNSAVAGTVQTCASKLGVDINDVGKKVTDMGKKVGQSTGASALLAKLPSQQKPDLSQSEEGGGLVQSVAYAAGAAITSTVGYGVYWLMTQG